jgi:hypothetical protein
MGSPESDPDSIHTRFLGGTKKLDARRKKKAKAIRCSPACSRKR